MSPPLAGRIVLLTRPGDRDADLRALLEAAGARCLHAAAIRIEVLPVDVDPEGLTWLAVTSPAAVRALPDRLREAARRGDLRTAALGDGTRRELEAAGIAAALTADEATGAGLARALRDAGCGAGDRVLHATSDRPRPELRETLETAGIEVVTTTTYRTRPGGPMPAAVSGAIAAGEVDAAVFASPSAAEGTLGGLPTDTADRMRETVLAAAIGPTTAAALRGAGFSRVVTAWAPSAPALAAALTEALGR